MACCNVCIRWGVRSGVGVRVGVRVGVLGTKLTIQRRYSTSAIKSNITKDISLLILTNDEMTHVAIRTR